MYASQHLVGAPLTVHVLGSGAPWVVSSALTGCSYPAATVLLLNHVPQAGSAAGCTSGRHVDGGLPWMSESLVEQGEPAVGHGGTVGAAAVEVGWGCSEWKIEAWEWMRKTRGVKVIGICS